MDTEFFHLTAPAADGIARLHLNRPERLNTLTPAFFPALRNVVQGLDDAGRTRVLVIHASGKHFSAGMALDVFAAGASADGAGNGEGLAMLDTSSARRRLAFQDGLRQLMRSFDALEHARFPVIAAIQGGCIGGALDLAAACDLRVASADAFFTVQEIHIGMAADLGVLQRLPKIVPPAVAREMAYTGERVSAERALAVGLVNDVRPDAEAALARALELAAQIAAKSPLAVAGSKRAINYAIDHSTAEALEQMTLLQSAIFDIAEMERAIAGWKAKQPAGFEPLAPLERG